MVLAWYLLVMLASLTATGLWLALSMGGKQTPFLVIWAHLTCIVYLPVMYALNPKTKNMGTIIIFAAALGAAILSPLVMMPVWERGVGLAVLVMAVLYVVSAVVSVGFNHFYRGRAVS